MSDEQGEAAEASAPTKTAPSVSGVTFAGGTIVENDIGESMEELLAAIDDTIKPFDEGDLMTGTIVKIDKDEVLVDIGYKSEGVIPSRELSIRNDVDPSDEVSLGEEIEALVLQKEDKDGRLILSKKRAQYERAWGRIEKIKEADGTVTGPVIEVVKGGLIIDIGLRGFLPASLVEMRRVRDLHPYVGKELECRIIELDKNRNNVVLSRRKFLEESQAEQRQEFLDSLAVGERKTGTVSSIVNFGAFVDLGGVDGLVHVSELSWKHVDHPSEVVEVGQEVEVEILDVDLDRERVSLSLKATQEDPWLQFARQHSVGDVIEGRVTKLVPFGAFVEVDDAIEGLIHISELAEHHVERPEDEVGVHDRLEVKIIDIDLDRRRISLSRKQALAPTAVSMEMPEGASEAVAGEEAPEPAAEMELEPEAGMELEPEAPQEEEDAEAATGAAEESVAAAGTTVPPAATDELDETTAEAPAAEATVTEETTVEPADAEEAEAPEAEEPQETAPSEEEEKEEAPAGDESIESILEDLKRERGK